MLVGKVFFGGVTIMMELNEKKGNTLSISTPISCTTYRLSDKYDYSYDYDRELPIYRFSNGVTVYDTRDGLVVVGLTSQSIISYDNFENIDDDII